VTINGIFLKAGIPSPRGSAVVETAMANPRFVSLISYDGSSLDPLEVFIKSKMTAVSKAVAGAPAGYLPLPGIPVSVWTSKKARRT